MSKITLGIDFGTTKTMVAWVNPKTGQHELIRLGEGRDYIPTTVFVESGGGMLFGEDADNEAVMAPEQYCRCFKMKMGSSSPALMFFEEGTPRSYSARQLAAAFLRHVKTLCEEKAVYDKVDAAVITRPVNFTPAQEEDLRLAAEEAGFKEITFITEPEAAGYAFCRLSPDEAFAHKALVVDWGGGTLDMAVVERQGEKVKTNRKYTTGDNTMGGEMFDAGLWHFVRTSVPELNVDTPAVQHNAHVQVRKAKEALSKRDEKRLSISTSAGPASISVKRSDFEALIGASVEKAAQQANSLVNKISKDSAAPEMLLLVGGSALIPLIQQQMEGVTKLPSRKWQYTREAVAIGAALWLSSSQPEVRKPKPPTFIPVPEPLDNAGAHATCEPTQALDQNNYRRGYQLFYGTGGCKQDLVAAAACFRQGYEAGDWNCGFALYCCYNLGTGVPKSHEECVSIARRMVDAGCPLGYCILSVCSSEGKGLPLDKSAAGDYWRKFKAAGDSMPSVMDEVRIEATMMANPIKDPVEVEKQVREYFKLSELPQRWGILSMSLLVPLLGNEDPPAGRVDEVRYALESGIKDSDPYSMMIAGIMSMGNNQAIWPHDVDKGMELLKRARNILPISATHMAYMMNAIDCEESDFKRMLNAAHLGASEMPLPSELNCRMRLVGNEYAAAYRVYDAVVAGALADEQKIDELVTSPLSPLLLIENLNSFAVKDASLVFRVPEQGVETIIKCPEPIPANSTVSWLLQDLDAPFGNDMSVELRANGKFSRIDFGDFLLWGAQDFVQSGYNPPPLLMCWKKGFFGGYVLHLICTEGTLKNVKISKDSGGITNPPIAAVSESAPADVGWLEFSDSNALKENELFVVECEGYSPVVGVILTTKDDKTSAGWANVAKIGGAVILGALGAS